MAIIGPLDMLTRVRASMAPRHGGSFDFHEHFPHRPVPQSLECLRHSVEGINRIDNRPRLGSFEQLEHLSPRLPRLNSCVCADVNTFHSDSTEEQRGRAELRHRAGELADAANSSILA